MILEDTRNDFMQSIYDMFSDDETNDRANQIIDIFDIATENCIELPTKFKLNSVVYVSPNNGKSFYRGFFCGVSLNNENKTTHIVCISDRVNFKNEKIKLNPIRHFYDYFLKLYSEEDVKQALRERENNEIGTIKH